MDRNRQVTTHLRYHISLNEEIIGETAMLYDAISILVGYVRNSEHVGSRLEIIDTHSGKVVQSVTGGSQVSVVVPIRTP